ncbi:Lipoprotein [Pararobbsia alpina]|uniref:hypothetical protein n=1 Tax=Pararobbsia alpina TaxID=621374 RepID=UPI0039A6C178
MQRIVFARIAGGAALAFSMAACVVQPPAQRVEVVREAPPPPPPPMPDPHEAAIHRFEQVQGRVGELSHRIDNHVNQGFYPPPVGNDLHHRVDVIWQEARDMASQHGGGLSGEEQRTLNQELDGAAHAIR